MSSEPASATPMSVLVSPSAGPPTAAKVPSYDRNCTTALEASTRAMPSGAPYWIPLMKTVVAGLAKGTGAGASAAPAEKTDNRTKIVDRDRTLAAWFMWDPLSVGPTSRRRRWQDRA